MTKTADAKVILVTQKTRLEELIRRYNTYEQAKFFIEHSGGDFDDYCQEHKTYHAVLEKAVEYLQTFGRIQQLDREHIPNYLFGAQDLVIAVGRDGLVANVLKYLDQQSLIGVNPDPARWDGCLLPFRAEDLPKIVPEAARNGRPLKTVTLAQVTLNDGQTLCGANDLFIGQKTHSSARYELIWGNRREMQSSSGIIVSTGLGATGWFKSILAGANGIAQYCNKKGVNFTDRFDIDASVLYYTVREPYPSTSTGAQLVFGKVDRNCPLQIISCMPENGVIFSDGMEQDYLQFNSGTVATVSISDRNGRLVI